MPPSETNNEDANEIPKASGRIRRKHDSRPSSPASGRGHRSSSSNKRNVSKDREALKQAPQQQIPLRPHDEIRRTQGKPGHQKKPRPTRTSKRRSHSEKGTSSTSKRPKPKTSRESLKQNKRSESVERERGRARDRGSSTESQNRRRSFSRGMKEALGGKVPTRKTANGVIGYTRSSRTVVSYEYEKSFFSTNLFSAEDKTKVKSSIKVDNIRLCKFGDVRAIYLLFVITTEYSERIKASLDVRLSFRRHKYQDAAELMCHSPKQLLGPAILVEQTDTRNRGGQAQVGLNSSSLTGSGSKGTQEKFEGAHRCKMIVSSQDRSSLENAATVTAHIFKHGSHAGDIPPEFRLQVVVELEKDTSLDIAGDIILSNGLMRVDEVVRGDWLRVRTSSYEEEEVDLEQWTSEQWKEHGPCHNFVDEGSVWK